MGEDKIKVVIYHNDEVVNTLEGDFAVIGVGANEVRDGEEGIAVANHVIGYACANDLHILLQEMIKDTFATLAKASEK